MKQENQCLAAALAAFPYEGKIVALEPFGAGHINDTYAVFVECYPEPHLAYILQRINTHVFKKPREVMENIHGVTHHIRHHLKERGENPARGVLHFLKTVDGDTAYFDAEGMPWRSYRFIEHSYCHDKAPTPELFYQSGKAFGAFLRMLDGYPAETLHETIPDFHNTPKRLEALRSVLAEDPLGRKSSCEGELAFALEREALCHELLGQQKAGRLPLRVTHNDTKLNNVLFDEDSGLAICVIDLDTIMPGLAASDFGDSIRFGATTAAEDEMDLSKVQFSLPLFEAYTRGYLEEAGATLTSAEKETLPLGAKLLTLECGIRFLTDHLAGDQYFKTDRPGQNLDRCRTQFKLVAEMERHYPAMQEIVAQLS